MTILVIDSDARVSEFLERGFTAEGYGVMTARDGAAGFDLAMKYPLKAIVTEAELPSVSGLDMCRRLRARGAVTPILMLSSRHAVDDRILGLRCGADDYLTKPFAFEELIARIEALIRRGRRFDDRPVKMRVDTLVFDRETLDVRRGERSIELTAKELSMLEFFMSAPGRVFSRVRILSNVWGASADPLSNIVDVYIGKLRRKIDGPNDAALIQTVRGRGYRIAAIPARDSEQRSVSGTGGGGS